MRKTVARLGFGFLSVISALALQSVHAAAQSQFEGGFPAVSAHSLQSAATDVQSQSVNAVTLGAGAFATGRWRRSSHDGLTTSANFGPPGMTHAFDTREHSFFGTGTYQLPGTWLGGNVKIGIVAGTNSLELEAKPNAINPAPAKGKIGSAENDSTMYGGSILWFNKGTYVSGMVLGHRGDSTLVDKFPGPGKFVTYNYDTSGFVANVVAGQVIELVRGPTGIKLDLRGSLGYIKNSGDTFEITVAPGPRFFEEFDFSAATVGFSPMLFADLAMAGGTLRPYVQGNFRKLFNYSNTTTLYGGPAGGFIDQFSFSEATFFSNVELGVNFLSGSWSFGAAYYHDWSGDTSTNGGKLGIAYKF